jgi:uncharacterized membrane protein HdeD (DUF308 family)
MFLNKWWLMVVQAILLFALSLLLFTRAASLITGSRYVFAIVALLTGAIAVFSYFFSNPSEKDILEMISGLFSCLAGIFFLVGGSLADGLTTWFYGAFMALNALIIVHASWYLRSEINWWWLSLVLLGYTIKVLLLFSAASTLLNIPIAVLAGIQFLLSGLMWILLAFVVRKLKREYSKTILEIIDQQKN